MKTNSGDIPVMNLLDSANAQVIMRNSPVMVAPRVRQQASPIRVAEGVHL